MAVSRAGLRLLAGRRGRGRTTVWLLAPAFLVVGGLGGMVLGSLSDAGLGRLIDAPVVQSAAVTVPADFGVCAGGVRVDCVVDGDTFWLAGTKIRIADIDTPEVSGPARGRGGAGAPGDDAAAGIAQRRIVRVAACGP